MRVLFKRLDPKASLPAKKYESDFCYDLVAVSEKEIAPNVWRYGFGFAIQAVREDVMPSKVHLAFDIRPRSSVWEHGMVLSNGAGTVDENYTGEVSAVFYHVMPDMPRYKVGDRVAQMKLGFTESLDFYVVDELNETDRGKNGYGSTGLAQDLK